MPKQILKVTMILKELWAAVARWFVLWFRNPEAAGLSPDYIRKGIQRKTSLPTVATPAEDSS